VADSEDRDGQSLVIDVIEDTVDSCPNAPGSSRIVQFLASRRPRILRESE
jgi:hypothetical protein